MNLGFKPLNSYGSIDIKSKIRYDLAYSTKTSKTSIAILFGFAEKHFLKMSSKKQVSMDQRK